MTPRAILGTVMVVAGVVLALFFRDLRVAWFHGGYLGVAAVLLGCLELWDARRAEHGRGSPGLVRELRDDLFGQDRTEDPPDRDDQA